MKRQDVVDVIHDSWRSQQTVGGREVAVGGRCEMRAARWQMANGRWQMADGKCRAQMVYRPRFRVVAVITISASFGAYTTSEFKDRTAAVGCRSLLYTPEPGFVGRQRADWPPLFCQRCAEATAILNATLISTTPSPSPPPARQHLANTSGWGTVTCCLHLNWSSTRMDLS